MPHDDHLVKTLANNPENDKKYTEPNFSIINDFYAKICLECLQELSYFNFFITGKRLT